MQKALVSGEQREPYWIHNVRVTVKWYREDSSLKKYHKVQRMRESARETGMPVSQHHLAS